jgi:DNA-binding CsgD family transcriptional regulator
LVDDLHWLDPASQEALMFAVRRLDRDAIGCVMTLRAGTPVPAGLPSRDLGGLGRDAAERLVEAIADGRPAPSVTGRLHAETRGNPLALVELSAALTAGQLTGAEMPEAPLEPGAAIRQRFAARLDRLNPAVRAALVVAAAAGSCPAADVTVAVALVLHGDEGEALEGAEVAGLVRVTADGVEFAHPLLRSVAYHLADPAERRAAHRALADVLAGRDPERVAWHLAAAATDPDEAAAAALEAAACLAARKGAPLTAAAAWERGAALSETGDARTGRLLQAAEAALRAGSLDRAGRLAATPGEGLPPQARARLLAVRGNVDFLQGRMVSAQRLLKDAAELAASDDTQLAASLLVRSLDAAFEAGLADEQDRTAQLMVRIAIRTDSTTQFLADLACGQLARYRGDPEEGTRLLRRGAARLEADPALALSAEREIDAVTAWALISHPDRAGHCADRAVQLARDAGALGQLPDALTAAAWCCRETGSWQRALALGSQAVDLTQVTGQAWLAVEVLDIMTSIEAAQGRDRDCRAHARELGRVSAERGLHVRQMDVRSHLALLEFGNGRLDDAIAHYEQAYKLWAAAFAVHHPYHSPVPDLIEAYAQAGQLDRAAALLPEFVAQVPRDCNPILAARAERCRGILAAVGEFDAHFLHAIALHEQCDANFQQARTHLRYGERLRRARRRRDARVQLRLAIEIFDRLDSRPWAERARAELRASGETVSGAGHSDERLTPQELQVALLVTQGKTNAEVGRAIFLSTRTVEFHLSRVYRKLGVASRTELTRRLTSSGFIPN